MIDIVYNVTVLTRPKSTVAWCQQHVEARDKKSEDTGDEKGFATGCWYLALYQFTLRITAEAQATSSQQNSRTNCKKLGPDRFKVDLALSGILLLWNSVSTSRDCLHLH